MGLLGQGVVAIWNGIRDEGRADFYAWHNREHMPERVGTPGFLRGRRYRALQAQPEFFTLYETQSTAVLSGAEYLQRLNHPTPWTRRTIGFFTDTSRSLCELLLSQGQADGAVLQTWRYEVPAEARASHAERMRAEVKALSEMDGVVGVHLCACDLGASSIVTEEKKGRPRNAPPGWVLLLEYAGDDWARLNLDPRWMSARRLLDLGAEGSPQGDWYALEVQQLAPRR